MTTLSRRLSQTATRSLLLSSSPGSSSSSSSLGSLSPRRTMASSPSSPPPSPATPPKKGKHDHKHDHAGHSHSLFSTHSHAHDVPSPDSLRAALMGKGDRGSRITLLGMASNVGLTGIKVFAGWSVQIYTLCLSLSEGSRAVANALEAWDR